MKMTRSQQWLSSLFLGAVILTSAALVYRIVAGGVDPYYEKWASDLAKLGVSSRAATAAADPRVVLMRGEPVTEGRTRLVYRGLSDDTVQVDLYLLDLDPEYGYPRRIPRSAEGEVLNLGGSRYRLVSTHRRQIVLSRVR